MAWWMAAAAGAQLGMGLLNAASSRRLARRQAELQRMETDEAVRRFRAEGTTRISAARAFGAASGIEVDSSSLVGHLTRMTTEFEREARWMREAGYAGARLTEQGADARFIGDLGGSLFQFGAANNWWQKTPGSGKGIGWETGYGLGSGGSGD